MSKSKYSSLPITTQSEPGLENAPLLPPLSTHSPARVHWIKRFFKFFVRIFLGVRPEYSERFINFKPKLNKERYVDNAVHNTKYNVITLLPLILFDQFKYFFNAFYLLVSLAQIVPALRVGPIFTYLSPLAFVLAVTITKEAIDDLKRYFRDRELNSTMYRKLLENGSTKVKSSELNVGDIITISANQRVPADLLFLRTSNSNGSTFIRTDQLDGEIDWKLRRAVTVTQNLPKLIDIFNLNGSFHIEAPKKDIYDFNGRVSIYGLPIYEKNELIENLSYIGLEHEPDQPYVEALTLENTLWANTVVTSGVVFAMVIFTGKETRTKMNASSPRAKMGIFDQELNFLSKLLFFFLLLLSFLLIIFNTFSSDWPITFLRYMLLTSSIIPISLRVNLEMAKVLYSMTITRDPKIPESVVRSSNIPEELGRVDYLLTDKTGTLTQNEMNWKRLHIGRASFTMDDKETLREFVFTHHEQIIKDKMALSRYHTQSSPQIANTTAPNPTKKMEVSSATIQVITALALCHNVYPIDDNGTISYQAASPDEVALVNFADMAGLKLVHRDERFIELESPIGSKIKYQILLCFPFTSELKRMGIIVKEMETQTIYFIVKGAESVIIPLLQPRGSNWVREECDNFARQGLRTLLIAWKEMSEAQWKNFHARYMEASAAMVNRKQKCQKEVSRIERDLTLLGLTGVEDKLFPDVSETLERLRNAGVRVWMLTGDKVETAICVAVSSNLKFRSDGVFVATGDEIKTPEEAKEILQNFKMGPNNKIFIVDGNALQILLTHCPELFIQVASQAPSVICCRCSPTQKAQVVTYIQKYTHSRTCAIGDGGNDVSMIQAANVGVGVVGKEGRQASLAADFSITQFGYLQRLLLWHGQNSYQRSSKLAHFVIHRGLIISIIQCVFSALFHFIPLSIFQGWLVVGYSTYYTMAPVFSLVLDVELEEDVVFTYPELYKDLKKGRLMSSKTFFKWVWVSIYQGSVIIILALVLFEDSVLNIIDIAFTSLILAELLNVTSEINTWHPLMIASEICSVVVYFYSMFILRDYFDLMFITTVEFLWKMAIITLASWLPIHLFNIFIKLIKPSHNSKLSPFK